MIKRAAAILLSLLSFQLSAQNVLKQTNNIPGDYSTNYETTMNTVLWALQNGSSAGLQALARLSNNQLSIANLQEQSKKFNAHYRATEDGASLKPRNNGKDKWCTYTYFIMNNDSSISYFLQLKVVFAQTNLVPVSRMKIGDAVQEAKIKSVSVLDSSELSVPNLADVYQALKEYDEFMKKMSTPEAQKFMKEVLDNARKKK